MALKKIQVPSLIEEGDSTQIQSRVDSCWAKHGLTEYIINTLQRCALTNGYRQPAIIRAVEEYLEVEVKERIIPPLKAILSNPDGNHVEKIRRTRSWPHKGLMTASDADPSYAPISKVVKCVFAEQQAVGLGASGKRLNPFFRRRTTSMQRALVCLIEEIIDYNNVID